MSTPEGKIKARIKKLLDNYKGISYYFMPVQYGYGKRTVDFLGCITGRFFAIEAKAPGKHPTELQNRSLAEIRAAGGETFVIDGAEGLECLARWLAGVATGVTT